jgi:mono/diheme cytochrome c family protein
MKIGRLTILMTILYTALGTADVNADNTTLPQSAWSTAPLPPASNLRDPLLQRGQQVFQARCQICHGEIPNLVVPGGLPPMPGTQALAMRYRGERPAMLEQRTDLTPEFVAAIVRNGINSMPYFRPTEVTDAELAALGAYLSRNNP